MQEDPGQDGDIYCEDRTCNVKKKKKIKLKDCKTDVGLDRQNPHPRESFVRGWKMTEAE